VATAVRPLLTAVYEKLTASSGLMAVVSGVYDEVPENAAFPYVSIGPLIEAPDDVHDRQGLDALLTVHVWSDQPGSAQAADIFAAVDAALDRQPLAVAGWTVVSVRHEQHQVLKDSDPSVRHINAQYRVRLGRAD
jgi:hypothetical protein